MKLKYIYKSLWVSEWGVEAKIYIYKEKVRKGDMIKKKSLCDDVKLELEWQIKQHLTFSDNTAVLGPDFQTDIKSVPEL